MGRPSARVGDSTFHGPPVAGAGCAKVLIGGRPSWRMGGDTHTCTMVNAPPPAGTGTPHGTGFATVGAATVVVGGMPATRMGDTITEPGANVPLPPPNPILGGEFTMLIGGPSVSMSVSASGICTCNFTAAIIVVGPPEFTAQALGDLAVLNAIPSGQALIRSIDNSGHTLTIVPAAAGAGNGASDGPWGSPNLTDGTGMDATVSFDPNRTVLSDGSQPWHNRPTAVGLGHEMTHASHIVNGDIPGDPFAGPGVPNDGTSTLTMNRALEERRTVGLGASQRFGLPDFSGEPFSENAIRRDLGEPLRPAYYDQVHPNIPVW